MSQIFTTGCPGFMSVNDPATIESRRSSGFKLAAARWAAEGRFAGRCVEQCVICRNSTPVFEGGFRPGAVFGDVAEQVKLHAGDHRRGRRSLSQFKLGSDTIAQGQSL